MSGSENICVCCKHPIVDETIEGDITLQYNYIEADFKDLAMGVDSNCRICAVILDAIATHVRGGYRSFMQSKVGVYSSSSISQEFRINIGDKIEVLRPSGMSKQFTATLELRLHKIFHATLSLP